MGQDKIMKIASVALTVAGMGLQIATGMLDDKKLDKKIAREVSKHLNKRR